MVSIYFAFGAVFNFFENGNRKLKLKLIPAWSHTFFRALKRLPDSTLSSHWLILMLTFLLIDSCEYFGFSQEPITWSLQPPYWTYVTASSQNGLFLDYLFAGYRLLELTWVTRSMKREGKNGGPMRGRLSIKTTQIPPFFCCITVFQSFLSLYIPLYFANFFFTLAKKIRRSAGYRSLFVCNYFLFLNFRVYQRSSVFWFWPL